MKEEQRLGERSETEADDSYWLKYFQQLQSVCAASPITAAVTLILPWYAASSPSEGAKLPWPPAMFMPSLDPPQRSAWCSSLCSVAHSFIFPCRPGLVSLLPSALSLLDCLFLALLHILLIWHSDCNYPFQCWVGSWKACLEEKKGTILGVGGTQIGTRLGFPLPWKKQSYCCHP